MFEKSRVRVRGSRGQIKCECEAVVSCGKRGASSHHGVSLTHEKEEEGEKEQEEAVRGQLGLGRGGGAR